MQILMLFRLSTNDYYNIHDNICQKTLDDLGISRIIMSQINHSTLTLMNLSFKKIEQIGVQNLVSV